MLVCRGSEYFVGVYNHRSIKWPNNKMDAATMIILVEKRARRRELYIQSIERSFERLENKIGHPERRYLPPQWFCFEEFYAIAKRFPTITVSTRHHDGKEEYHAERPVNEKNSINNWDRRHRRIARAKRRDDPWYTCPSGVPCCCDKVINVPAYVEVTSHVPVWKAGSHIFQYSIPLIIDPDEPRSMAYTSVRLQSETLGHNCHPFDVDEKHVVVHGTMVFYTSTSSTVKVFLKRDPAVSLDPAKRVITIVTRMS